MIIARHNTHELATWMPDDIQRIKVGDQYLFAHGEPAVIAGQALKARWHTLPDGYAVARGDLDRPTLRTEIVTGQLNRVRLADGSAVPLYPLTACDGSLWWVPQLLSMDSSGVPRTTLSIPWGRSDSGVLCRVPSDRQRKTIDMAQAIHAEITTKPWDEIEQHVVAEWASEILAMSYYLSADAFISLGYIDDHIALRALTACCGMGTPEDCDG